MLSGMNRKAAGLPPLHPAEVQQVNGPHPSDLESASELLHRTRPADQH